MWIDDETNLLHDLFNNREIEYPAICPVCKDKSAHIYLYKHDSKTSGYWCWCSSCKRYEHSSGRSLDWWNNVDLLNLNKLESEPYYLEVNKNKIDKWVNILNGFDHYEDFARIYVRKTIPSEEEIKAGSYGTILESSKINGKYLYLVELSNKNYIDPVVSLCSDDIEYDYETNSKYFAIQIAQQFLRNIHNQQDIINDYLDEDKYFLAHVFFGDEFNEPLFNLLENDGSELEIVEYTKIIIMMFNIDNSYIRNILDVTIFERLSDSLKVWNRLASFLPNNIIKYINEELIPNNILMNHVKQMSYNPICTVIDYLLEHQNKDNTSMSNWVLSWLELQYKRYLHTLGGKHDMRKPLELGDYPWGNALKELLLSNSEFNALFVIDNNLFDFKNSILEEDKLFIERQAFINNLKYVCL